MKCQQYMLHFSREILNQHFLLEEPNFSENSSIPGFSLENHS